MVQVFTMATIGTFKMACTQVKDKTFGVSSFFFLFDFHRSYDVGGVFFDSVTVIDKRNRAFLRGDTPPPHIVRAVHGSVAVQNPYGCNTSIPHGEDISIALGQFQGFAVGQ